MSEPAKQLRVHGDVDGHRIGELESGHEELKAELKELKHETDKRIGRLERFQSFVFGAGAAISALAGYLLKSLKGE